MMIGTVRPEEAKAFDSDAGYQHFRDEDGNKTTSTFEVFWVPIEPFTEDKGYAWDKPGWYWAAGSPGCIHDGEWSGPFASSTLAYNDAQGE